MKQINIFSLSLFALLSCAPQLQAKAKTEQDIANDNIKAIVSNHTRVFSKENLLLSAIAAEDHQAWITLINNLRDYVRNRQPEVLRYPSNTLFQIAEQVEDTISSIFTEDIAPAFTSEKAQREGVSASGITQKIDYSKVGIDTNKLNMSAITAKLARLKNFKKSIAEIQSSFKPDTSKKGVAQGAKYRAIKLGITKPTTAAEGCLKEPKLCEILDTLAMYLEATIDKAVKDFEKLKIGFGLA